MSPSKTKHPKALPFLFFSEMWERFGYYLMIGIFTLYLKDVKGGFAMTEAESADLYGTFIGLVFLTPFLGGLLADRYFGYRNSIIAGGLQTVQLDITAFLKTVKKNKHKFYPAFIHILARLMTAHPEFRMAMKDGELVIWDSVHPCYTVFHEQTETFSSLWIEYHDDFRQFLHIYSQDGACYGENLAYFPKGFIENMFFVSANPWVSFTSFDLNVAHMDNFFAPVFTMGKYYTQGDKVLMPLAIQVHHAVCDGFHVGRMLNELQQYCDEWQGGAYWYWEFAPRGKCSDSSPGSAHPSISIPGKTTDAAVIERAGDGSGGRLRAVDGAVYRKTSGHCMV